MNCLTEEILKAKLDGELSPAEMQEADAHLAECSLCRERAHVIAHQAQEVQEVFASLAPPPGERGTDSSMAWARFQARRRAAQAVPSFFGALFAKRLRPAWGALALAGVIVLLVSFAPARTWAQKLLAMFRVEKITVVPVDLKSLGGSNGETTAGKMLGKMISDDLVVTIHGEAQPVASPEEAMQKAGFQVRLLSTRTDPPKMVVEGEQAFHLTVNRERAQSVLDEAGRSDLILPDSVDGATIAFHIPSAVIARYGTCPEGKPKAGAENSGPPSTPTPDFSNCIVVGQVPSPTVSVPPNLNVSELMELGFQASGMSAQQAHDFCQTVDWTSTLVLPVPRFASSYQTVTVDGVEGTLISTAGFGPRRPAGYVLMWVKNGMIYSVMGFGDSSNAIPLADSLN